MSESGGKLGSRKRDTLGINLYGWKSILGERRRGPDLILNGYLLKNSLILFTIY
jgi:hypothetical protein